MKLSEHSDFFFEFISSFHHFLHIFLRVNWSVSQGILEPLLAIILVLKELRKISYILFAFPDELCLFLGEYLAQIACFPEDYRIVLQYLEAVFLISRKREPNQTLIRLV